MSRDCKAVVEKRAGAWYVKLVGADAAVVSKHLAKAAAGDVGPFDTEEEAKRAMADEKSQRVAKMRRSLVRQKAATYRVGSYVKLLKGVYDREGNLHHPGEIGQVTKLQSAGPAVRMENGLECWCTPSEVQLYKKSLLSIVRSGRGWHVAKAVNRTGLLGSIAFVLNTGRANPETEHAVARLFGMRADELDLQELTRLIKKADDAMLVKVAQTIDNLQPGRLPAGWTASAGLKAISRTYLVRRHAELRLRALKGATTDHDAEALAEEERERREGRTGGVMKVFKVGDEVQNTYTAAGVPTWMPGKVVEVVRGRKVTVGTGLNRRKEETETRYRVNIGGKDYWVDESALESKSLSFRKASSVILTVAHLTDGFDGPGWYVLENGRPVWGPFDTEHDATDTKEWHERKNMKHRRKFYGVGTKAVLLKSEGIETSPETLEYLAARGYDDVSVEDGPPLDYQDEGVAPAAQPEQVAEHIQEEEFQHAAGEKGALTEFVEEEEMEPEHTPGESLEQWAEEEEMEPEHMGIKRYRSKRMRKFVVKAADEYVDKDGELSDEPVEMSWSKAVAVAKEMSNITDAKVEPWPLAADSTKLGANTPVRTKLDAAQTPVGAGEKQWRKGMYRLTSVKGSRTVSGSEADAIRAAKKMDDELQPAMGVDVEDEHGNTVATVSDGKVERAFKSYRVRVKGVGWITKGGTTNDADDAEEFSLGKAVQVAKEFDGEIEEKDADLEGDEFDPASGRDKRWGRRKSGKYTARELRSRLFDIHDQDGTKVEWEGKEWTARQLRQHLFEERDQDKPQFEDYHTKGARRKSDPLEGDAEDTRGVPIGLRTLRKHIKGMEADLNHKDLEHDGVKSALKACTKILRKARKKAYGEDDEVVDKWAVRVGRKSWVSKSDELVGEPHPMSLDEAQEKADDHDGQVEEMKFYTVKVGKRYVSKSGKLEGDPQPVCLEEAQKMAKATDGEVMSYDKAVEEEDKDLDDVEMKTEEPPVLENKADGVALVDEEGKTVEGPFEDRQEAVKALRRRMYRSVRRRKTLDDDAIKEPIEEALKFLKDLGMDEEGKHKAVVEELPNNAYVYKEGGKFYFMHGSGESYGPYSSKEEAKQRGTNGPKGYPYKALKKAEDMSPEELKALRQRSFAVAKGMEDALEEAHKSGEVAEGDLTKSEEEEIKAKALDLEVAMGRTSDALYRQAGVRLFN